VKNLTKCAVCDGISQVPAGRTAQKPAHAMRLYFRARHAQFLPVRFRGSDALMVRLVLAAVCVLAAAGVAVAEPPAAFVPRRQAGPPGPPLAPGEAVSRMSVPPGFAVELVAAEPDVVNPVAMAFDERGRVWVAESFEYPRLEAGPGRDRVRVLADTDGDGRADSVSTFLEGLNIPSGIAVGHGGVWIAAAPDLLFVRDTDGDGRGDRREVVVTGFGRHDTHELPNSLTWGPDGWLYGLNGVFNASHVRYAEGNPNHRADHPGWRFDCAMFRVHPRTREFEVFSRGTSNPWGIAFNDEGDAFVSACVIDHLWHLVEGGFYHRQAGPQPREAWKLDSIVAHKHQLAAYCGITWFDSDAYPETYRRRLFMGNVHGGCINVDRIERAGSTYRGLPDPDFLTANDVWFMPVVQKTGPDGCLWILDWYDRYHCYQDAMADPAGIDRARGRLYRVTHEGTPPSKPFDLADRSDAELVALLGHPNVWMRETAQRLIGERSDPATARLLLDRLRATDDATPQVHARHMLFALAGCDIRGRGEFHEEMVRTLAAHPDPFRRAWAFRMSRLPGGAATFDRDLLLRGLADTAAPVRLQAAIAIGSAALDAAPHAATLDDFVEPLVRSLLAAPDDLHHARFVWRALHAISADTGRPLDGRTLPPDVTASPAGTALVARILDWQMAATPDGPQLAARLSAELARPEPSPLLQQLVREIRAGRFAGASSKKVRRPVRAAVADAAAGPAGPRRSQAIVVAAACGDEAAAAEIVDHFRGDHDLLVAGLAALVTARSPRLCDVAPRALAADVPDPLRSEALAVLARSDEAAVATTVLAALPDLPAGVRPRAIDLLTQRAAWARALLEAVDAGRLAQPILDANQVQRLATFDDAELAAAVRARWGAARPGRNPDRDRVVAEMRTIAATSTGDPRRGEAVFTRVCAGCHRIHGRGAEVGPDITANGRASFDQLLANIFDPSLVIGAAYRSCTVVTDEGRAVTGLLVEEGPDRIVLKAAGGTLETIPRSRIDEFSRNDTSLMPEGIERQCEPRELADLLAFLCLDRPPADPAATPIPGTPATLLPAAKP